MGGSGSRQAQRNRKCSGYRAEGTGEESRSFMGTQLLPTRRETAGPGWSEGCRGVSVLVLSELNWAGVNG